MYINPNFKTKKAFKEAVQRGDDISYYQPGLGPTPLDGKFCAEGPHYPEPHRWYAECVVKDGKIIKVI